MYQIIMKLILFIILFSHFLYYYYLNQLILFLILHQIIILLILILFLDILNDINIHYINLLLYMQILLSLIYCLYFSITSLNLKNTLMIQFHYKNYQNIYQFYFQLLNLLQDLVHLLIMEILKQFLYKIIMLFI